MTDLSHLFDSPECLALYRVKRERDALLRLIAKAPHARHCEFRAAYGRCTCWKSEAELATKAAA